MRHFLVLLRHFTMIATMTASGIKSLPELN
jgi:hypothetical protein